MSAWLNTYKYGNPATPETNAKGKNPMAAMYGAPHLNGEGAKVRPEWLFKFLHNPEEIRPWMIARMPTFATLPPPLGTVIIWGMRSYVVSGISSQASSTGLA